MDKISVVIPTYNRADHIVKSVQSVLDQTHKADEIIIVDDGSTDDTKERIDSLHESCIRYVKQENAGASVARNKGAEIASGDWIAFNDSDDVWRPDKLEEQIKKAAENPEFDLIYSAYSFNSPTEKIDRVPYIQDECSLQGDIFLNLLVMNSVGTPTVMVKKAAFLETGGFDVGLECLEDWYFAVRFAKSHKVGFVDKVLVDAYSEYNGVSTKQFDMFNVRCRMIAEYKDIMLENNIFDRAVTIMFDKAREIGCLEQVQKMLMLYLKG